MMKVIDSHVTGHIRRIIEGDLAIPYRSVGGDLFVVIGIAGRPFEVPIGMCIWERMMVNFRIVVVKGRGGVNDPGTGEMGLGIGREGESVCLRFHY